MSICPFWSDKKEKVSCFQDCAFASDKEMCPFKLYLDNDDIPLSKVVEFDNEAIKYSED